MTEAEELPGIPELLLGAGPRAALSAPAVPALPPYYIGGPYHDGSYSMCETATGRILFKVPAAPQPQEQQHG